MNKHVKFPVLFGCLVSLLLVAARPPAFNYANVGFYVAIKATTNVNSSNIIFDSLVTNTGGGYRYSAPYISYFQAPEAGYYHVDALASIIIKTKAMYQVSLYKRNSKGSARVLTTVVHPANIGYAEPHGFSTNIYLEKDDIVNVWVEGALVTVVGQDQSYFSGYKVF